MKSRPRARRHPVLAALVSSAMLAATLIALTQRPAAAAISAVRGDACGFYVNVGLFGGPQMLKGCGSGLPTSDIGYSPQVTLPTPNGSATALTALDADGARADYGPASIFAGKWPETVSTAPPSGPIDVSTKGTPSGGVVTSAVNIKLRSPADPDSPGGFGPGPVEGDELHASCKATATSVTGTVSIVNGILTKTTTPDGSPLLTEPIPASPAVNYTRSGVITNVGDVFTVVFNQQIVNADGSLTVNAFHMYLFGPTAVGESVGGQVTCGTTPSAIAPSDTVNPTCGIPVAEPVAPDDPTPQVPRKELVGVFDAGGLQSITNIQAVNATVQIGDPSSAYAYLKFTPGQTGPLAMTATRVDESQPMSWSFDATDVAGHTKHCKGVAGPTYLSVNDLSVTEGDSGTSNANFTLTRSGNLTGTSSVKWATATGTASTSDFTTVAITTVSFAAYETTKTLTVPIKGDLVDEPNETFKVNLSSPVGAILSDLSGTGTIVDNEGTVTPGPSTFLSVNDVSVMEGNTGVNVPAIFTVTRSGNTSGTTTVNYVTVDGSAVAASDYTAKPLTTLTFSAGQTTKTVTVTVTGDLTVESDETFTLKLSSPSGASISDKKGVGTIVNND